MEFWVRIRNKIIVILNDGSVTADTKTDHVEIGEFPKSDPVTNH